MNFSCFWTTCQLDGARGNLVNVLTSTRQQSVHSWAGESLSSPGVYGLRRHPDSKGRVSDRGLHSNFGGAQQPEHAWCLDRHHKPRGQRWTFPVSNAILCGRKMWRQFSNSRPFQLKEGLETLGVKNTLEAHFGLLEDLFLQWSPNLVCCFLNWTLQGPVLTKRKQQEGIRGVSSWPLARLVDWCERWRCCHWGRGKGKSDLVLGGSTGVCLWGIRHPIIWF